MKHAVSAGDHYMSTPCLNSDVLWIIFSFNTFSDDDFTKGDDNRVPTDKFLLTARHTSQVCKLWRSIMLSSPRVWANVLNFRYLQQKDNTWRNEVLRRTGTALLSVIGHDLKKDAPGINFFLSLVSQKARRIRRILTSTKGDHQGVAYDLSWTSIFLQEVPHLEIACFTYYNAQGYSGLNKSLSKIVLFNNKRSKIHTLILRGFQLFLPGPWNATIRRLEIEMGIIEHPFILSLNCMRQLESLYIKKLRIMEDPEEEVKIPNIRQFYFENNLRSAAVLLDLMLPTEGSTSSITIIERESDILPDQLQSRLCNGLIRHLKGRFSDKLSLNIQNSRIKLANALTFSTLETINATFTLSFNFFTDIIQCLLLNILSAGSIATSITHLDLYLDYFEFGKHDGVDELVECLFNSMQSVEVLCTTMYDLPILTERLHKPEICFPRLHTLAMKPQTQSITITLVDFIEKRRRVGFPLKKITATGFERVDPDVLWYLRGRSDLEFEWVRPPSRWETRRRRM